MSRKKQQKTWGGAPWWGWALVGIGAVVAIVALVVGSPRPGPDVSAAPYTPPPLTKQAADQLFPLTLPARGERVTFFGDSWTSGSSAAPGYGYAHVTGAALGADTVVLGRVSTGYVNPGQTGAGTYLTRINNLPVDPATKLLVLQGGLNDSGQTEKGYFAAVEKTIAAAEVKFPNAEIVLLGPIPAKMESLPSLRKVDRALASATEDAGVHYISPIRDEWITSVNVADIINPQTLHPTTDGHAQLSQRLLSALHGLTTTPKG